MSRDKIKECLRQSRKLSGCPRPNMGSISHFCNIAVDKLLSKMCEREQSEINKNKKLRVY